MSTNRVIILIDMDCFYCQVEEKLNPSLKGKPIAVVQYNAWRGGGIIAVNYPARDEGVTRHMRGNEAKKKCPKINLVRVPELRGKADLTKYRDAGKQVADVLAKFTPLLERASVDEAYLDVTELVEKHINTNLENLTIDNLSNSYVVGCELKEFLIDSLTNKEFCTDNLKLAVGALITEEIRREVLLKTGYKCSAGVAHNKVLAKLVCSLHKPNKQTILPQDAVPKFFETMPISKIKNLGGKFGQTLSQDFQITYMGQLAKIPEKDLAKKYDEKTGNWLYHLSRGIDMEAVTQKLISKSIASCKNFPGRSALTTYTSVEHWLNELAAEISERLVKDLEENNRKAKQIVVSFSQEINKKDVHSTRTHPLTSYDPKKIAHAAHNVINKFCLRDDGSYHLKFLGLSAGHFEDVKKIREITSFFKVGELKSNLPSKVPCNVIDENCDTTNIEMIDQNVYYQTTQELQENPECLVFYNDSFRVKSDENSSTSVMVLNYSNSICDDSSISNAAVGKQFPVKSSNSLLDTQELNYSSDSSNNDKQESTDGVNLNKSSFFSKYFDNISPVQSPKKTPLHQNDNEIKVVEQAEVKQEHSEICLECRKPIPILDLQSHQDYHFALKLSESETVVQKLNVKTTTVPSHKKGRPKGVKRKVESNGTLTTFFKKEHESEMTEVCLECNKRIKIDELISHMDYHAAKKLQQELNSVKPITAPTTKSSIKKPSKRQGSSSANSIMSFFRPT